MKIALVAALIALALLGFLIMRRRKSEAPVGWTAVTNSNDYGTKTDGDSFNFPVGNPAEVAKLPLDERPGAHCITRSCGSLARHTGLRLTYRVEIDPGVELHPSSDPAAEPVGPTIYFQRGGDDWSGDGKYDGYRWWATFNAPSPIVAGDFVIDALFSKTWTGVRNFNSLNNDEAFEDALAHAAHVGGAFGGGTGYSHGVFATGRARCTFLKLEMI